VKLNHQFCEFTAGDEQNNFVTVKLKSGLIRYFSSMYGLCLITAVVSMYRIYDTAVIDSIVCAWDVVCENP